jgi:alkylation response protein AidB-like acyl-CoA dehydrogenase
VDFGLSEDQREIQRTARDLLAERARPERVREHAESGTTDTALWRELCDLGWPGIAVAERYGGQGLGSVELGILCEELGRTVAPVPFLPSALAATLIEHAGSEGQCERWLPALASGESIGAVGVASGAAGTDVRDGVAMGAGSLGGTGAAGVCELMIGAPDAQLLVLIEGERARVLERAEVELAPRAAIDPTRSAAQVRAPDGAGETLAGAATAAGVDRALVAIASELVGVCDRALSMTVAYVKERRQFGVPVGSFQAVAHRCAQMLLDTEKARSTAAFAAWTADADPERLGEAAAMAKAAASDAGVDVTASAIQAHGGIGFTWEADVHWLYKRAQIDAALLGGAKHQRARLAGLLAVA